MRWAFRLIPRHRPFRALGIHRSAPVGPRPSGTAQPAENPCATAGSGGNFKPSVLTPGDDVGRSGDPGVRTVSRHGARGWHSGHGQPQHEPGDPGHGQLQQEQAIAVWRSRSGHGRPRPDTARPPGPARPGSPGVLATLGVELGHRSRSSASLCPHGHRPWSQIASSSAIPAAAGDPLGAHDEPDRTSRRAVSSTSSLTLPLLASMAITSWRGCSGLLIGVGVGMLAVKRVCRQRAG
jgi:hypothetical protein